MKELFLTILLLSFGTYSVQSQDPLRFKKDIENFSKIKVTEGEDLVVFTGSSSIRFWENLAEDCHATKAINTGFGGSHTSDLLFYIEETVLRFNPVKVYIYEGDNDIAANKNPMDILATTKQVISKIQAHNPTIEIYLISAKPSPARWAFKQEYEALNALFKQYCTDKRDVFYIDIWDDMLDEKGYPNANIFIADSLHMNRDGYLIWRNKICGGFKE